MKLPVWHYKVTGRGYFPADMLRYDEAWPQEPHKCIFYPADVKNSLPERTVEICGIMEPTQARWQSFGWTVHDVEKGAFHR